MSEKKFLTDITNVCFTHVVGDSAINWPPQCDPYLKAGHHSTFTLIIFCYTVIVMIIWHQVFSPLDLIKQIKFKRFKFAFRVKYRFMAKGPFTFRGYLKKLQKSAVQRKWSFWTFLIQYNYITAKIIISFHGVLLTRSDSSVSFNEQQKGQTEVMTLQT